MQVREGTHDCVVVAGVLDDPYTGRPCTFVKADAAEVPIDHVVPLAAAWVQGAAGVADRSSGRPSPTTWPT